MDKYAIAISKSLERIANRLDSFMIRVEKAIKETSLEIEKEKLRKKRPKK